MESAALAEIVGGELIGSGREVFSGVTIDSRDVLRDSLFVALKGEKFDGVDFIEEAARKGAKGALVPKKTIETLKDKVKLKDEFFYVEVKDTLRALQCLAQHYRLQTGVKIVGVTGSTGKTTTRDYIKSVLSQKFKVAASPKNFNNEIGVPLTLLNYPDTSELIVLEMAMRGLGELAKLAEISRPEIGVITSIGLAHYERLGSQDKIAQAKAELIQALPTEGLAIIPGESKYSGYLEGITRAKTLKFGFNPLKSFIRAEKLRMDKMARPEFRLVYGSEKVEVKLNQNGRHFVLNALAAAAVGYAFGLSGAQVKEGLEKASLSSMRGEVENFKGVWLINDTYNSNPDSMNAALELLNDFEASRKIACLGDMLELGEISEEQHRLTAKKINSLNLSLLILVGHEVRWIEKELLQLKYNKKIKVFRQPEDAGLYLAGKVRPGDAVLFKASRLISMEKALQTLKERLKDV